jgi:hypothetical protein
MPRYNPFKPSSIVSPGMFSGRGAEIAAIEQALFQTRNGNPQHFLIHGERGIGKSSLLYYVDILARGQITIDGDTAFSFLTITLDLESSNTYGDIIRRIANELRRQLASHQPATELVKALWDFAKHFEVKGIKYDNEPERGNATELLEELTFAIDKTLEKLVPSIDGVVILIDEADKAPAAHLGEFVKLFTERLTKRGCNQVCLGIAGISTLLNQLRQSHESSLRVFQIFTLEPLLPKERSRVLQLGLAEAEKVNRRKTVITPDAEMLISELSEGYPHFIQQFAYCAFDADDDDAIDRDDVQRGAVHPDKGAIQQLGLKYFHELYFDQIGSDEYRAVLRGMADHLDSWVKKSELRKNLKIKDYTLNNAIAALRKKHIILSKPGVSGVYRLPTKSFAVWMKAYTKDQ